LGKKKKERERKNKIDLPVIGIPYFFVSHRALVWVCVHRIAWVGKNL